MYYAIVFLPLVGAIVAALITLAGARARYPGGSSMPGAENRAADAIEHLHGDEVLRVCDQGKQQRPDRQCPKAKEQQRAAPPTLSLLADPWRNQGDEDLGYNDQRRDDQRRLTADAMPQRFAGQR